MDDRPFGLTDDEYWKNPLARQDPVLDDLAGRRGLVLDAPRRVSVEAKRTLPIAIAIGERSAVMRQAPFEGWVILVAVYDDGTARAKAAEEALPPEQDDFGVVERDEGWAASTRAVDAREQLGIPWGRGGLRLAALHRDLLSNRIRIQLEGPPLEGARPPRAGAISPPADPAHPLPRYGDAAGAPPPPAAPGIALAAERVVPLKAQGQAPIPLRGSFRVRAPAWMSPGDDVRMGDPPPGSTFHVPVHLVITGATYPAPVVSTIVVPGVSNAQGEVVGSFAVDLLERGLIRHADTWFVHAFAVDEAAAPATMALVSEEQLRQE